MNNLPESNQVNVSILARIFNDTTTSYKYLYFLSILDIIKRKQFNISSISFQEIIIEMLANAWYPHNYFKLSFGTQDKIADQLDTLKLEITEPILKFKDPDKEFLRETIKNQNINSVIKEISRYVPYRFIHPFFEREIRGLKDSHVNHTIIQLSRTNFHITKPFYYFNTEEAKECSQIILNSDWLQYFQDNYVVVRGWFSWEFLKYMQQKNPNVTNLVNKLFIPKQRDVLTKQTKYWKTILGHQKIQCIYSKVELDSNSISLDHYLPWSFVAHDQLWNLIPTIPSVNSSKSNHLPALKYFKSFVELQHLGLTVYRQNVLEQQWLKDVESFIADLKVEPENLLNLQVITTAYEQTLNPLITLATTQGFSADWVYENL